MLRGIQAYLSGSNWKISTPKKYSHKRRRRASLFSRYIRPLGSSQTRRRSGEDPSSRRVQIDSCRFPLFRKFHRHAKIHEPGEIAQGSGLPCCRLGSPTLNLGQRSLKELRKLQHEGSGMGYRSATSGQSIAARCRSHSSSRASYLYTKGN